MSILTTNDVFCDWCRDYASDCGDDTVQKARENANDRGWSVRYTRYGKALDICPNCIDRALKGEPPHEAFK